MVHNKEVARVESAFCVWAVIQRFACIKTNNQIF